MGASGFGWREEQEGERERSRGPSRPKLARKQEFPPMEHARTHPPLVFHVFRGLRYHQEWSPPLTPTATAPGANVSSFCPWGATCDHIIFSLGRGGNSDVINERMNWSPAVAFRRSFRLSAVGESDTCSCLLAAARSCPELSSDEGMTPIFLSARVPSKSDWSNLSFLL